MGLMNRAARRAAERASKDIHKHNANLSNVAVTNDKGYDKLIETIQEINNKRKAAGNYVRKVS